jgi:glycosyltransferase involved in cell wall biosynthesis
MRVVHLLRKCDPAEWGGTETAIQRLIEGLREQGVASVVHCPRLHNGHGNGQTIDPLAAAGCPVRRYRAFVPIWGISRRQRQQHIAVGGNLMSFDLFRSLWKEPEVSVIHTHTLGRLGGIASSVARRRGVPLVVTIHGGLLDLPAPLKKELNNGVSGGFDWGRVFGLLLKSRRLLEHADAVLTCNSKEAELLRQQHPEKRVQVQSHGVPVAFYRKNHRTAALEAFPQIHDRSVLLCVGRIDPVKNQGWLITEAAQVFAKHPKSLLVLAGGCTDEAYGELLRRQIQESGFQERILMAGNLPPADPRLIGLFQMAEAVILPSLSETFGLVILEAWAAGTTVIASRTSGASALIKHGENGWLFDLKNPSAFHDAVALTLCFPELRERLARSGNRLAATEYDTTAVAARLKELYGQLTETKNALRHSAGR